jgi:hypothetical protein
MGGDDGERLTVTASDTKSPARVPGFFATKRPLVF